MSEAEKIYLKTIVRDLLTVSKSKLERANKLDPKRLRYEGEVEALKKVWMYLVASGMIPQGEE